MSMDWISVVLAGAGIVLAAVIGFVVVALRIDLDKLWLRDLEKRGVALQQPQALEFLLLFRHWPSAERAAQALRRDGEYQVQVEEAGGSVACRARRVMVPELKQLHRIRERMYGLSRPQGGTYEGWKLVPTEDHHAAA